MSKSDRKTGLIPDLIALLKKDASDPHHKYPSQSQYALKDERVLKALEDRLNNNKSLTAIETLEYNFFTGLNQIYFQFASPAGIGLVPDAILVVMDHDARVVGIVDPFNPNQPNRLLPILPKEGEQPFVLSRPSVAESASFNKQQLYPRQVRNKEFFSKLLRPEDGPICGDRT